MKTIEQSGYIFNFTGHGAFDPDGKIDGTLTQSEIDQHNGRLARAEMESIRKSGIGVLYLFCKKSDASNIHYPDKVGTWASADTERISIARYRTSRNNWGAKRTDVWFYLDGKTWHGVNIGDNDIVRVKRNKRS